MVKTYTLKFKVDVDSKTNKMFTEQAKLTETMERNFVKLNKTLKVATVGGIIFGNTFKKAISKNLGGPKAMLENLVGLEDTLTGLKTKIVNWGDASGDVKSKISLVNTALALNKDALMLSGKQIEWVTEHIDALGAAAEDASKKGGMADWSINKALKDTIVLLKAVEKAQEKKASPLPTLKGAIKGTPSAAGAGIAALGAALPKVKNKVTSFFDTMKAKGQDARYRIDDLWFSFKKANIVGKITPKLNKLWEPLKKIGGKGQAGLKGLGGKFKTVFSMIKANAAVFIGMTAALFGIAMASPQVQAQMALMGASMQRVSIIVGEALNPFFEGMNLILTTLLDTYNNLSPELKMAIQMFLFLTAAIGGVIILLPILGAALTILMGPVGLILLAIAALALAWGFNLGGIRDVTDRMVKSITAIFDSLMKTFDKILNPETFVQGLIDLVQQIIGGISLAIAGIPLMILEMFGNILVDIGNFIKTLPFGDVIGEIFIRVGKVISNIAGGIIDILAGIASLNIGQVEQGWNKLGDATRAITGNYEEGGIVGGTGPVPIIAHGKEMVLTPSDQQSLLGFIRGQQNNTTNNINVNLSNALGLSNTPNLFGTDVGRGISKELRRRGA